MSLRGSVSHLPKGYLSLHGSCVRLQNLQMNSRPDKQLSLDYRWIEVFRRGESGDSARRHFLSLDQMRRFESDPVFKLLFDGGSHKLSRMGVVIGVFFNTLDFLSAGRISPFRVTAGIVEFSSFAISAKRVIAKIVSRLSGAPYYFAGGLLLNVLGFHVVRVLFFNIRHAVRVGIAGKQRPDTEMVRQLKKYGYVVVDRMLSPSILWELNSIFEAPEKLSWNKREHHPAGWRKCTIHAGGMYLSAISATELSAPVSAVLADARIFDTVETLSGRRIVRTPEIAIFEWKVPEKYLGKAHQFDFEDLMHADVAYPTFKIFLYLNDVTLANGPFVYCPGSHRFSFRRLCFEYIASVAYFSTQRTPPEPPQPHRFTDWFVRKFGPQPVPLVGPANTMVLANVMGFHGRARFENTEPRRALFLNFRYLDASSAR